MTKTRLLFLLIMFMLALQTKSQSIYSMRVPSLTGGNIELNVFSGKKLMFVIMPISDFDSIKLRELKNFQTANQSKVQVIGILSIDHGYHDSLKSRIILLYQKMSISVPLTEGMHTKKSSGSMQGEIAKWLTHKALNKINDEELEGIFQKFLVNKSCKLTNVFYAYTSFQSPAIKFSLQVP